MSVRSRQNAERAIVDLRIIKVNPYSNHACEHFGWWLHLPDPNLPRPTDKSRSFETFRDGNRVILVPKQGPIGICHLIEKNRANCERVLSEKGGYKLANTWASRQRSNGGTDF